MYAIKLTTNNGVEHWMCQRFTSEADANKAAKLVKDNGLPDDDVEVVLT